MSKPLTTQFGPNHYPRQESNSIADLPGKTQNSESGAAKSGAVLASFEVEKLADALRNLSAADRQRVVELSQRQQDDE